jgi:hypothetical protein
MAQEEGERDEGLYTRDDRHPAPGIVGVWTTWTSNLRGTRRQGRPRKSPAPLAPNDRSAERAGYLFNGHAAFASVSRVGQPGLGSRRGKDKRRTLGPQSPAAFPTPTAAGPSLSGNEVATSWRGLGWLAFESGTGFRSLFRSAAGCEMRLQLPSHAGAASAPRSYGMSGQLPFANLFTCSTLRRTPWSFSSSTLLLCHYELTTSWFCVSCFFISLISDQHPGFAVVVVDGVAAPATPYLIDIQLGMLGC